MTNKKNVEINGWDIGMTSEQLWAMFCPEADSLKRLGLFVRKVKRGSEKIVVCEFEWRN